MWRVKKGILIHISLLFIILGKSCMRPIFLLLSIIGFKKKIHETSMWSHNYPVNLCNEC